MVAVMVKKVSQIMELVQNAEGDHSEKVSEIINTIDPYLQSFKPEGAPCHYKKCLSCGKGDISISLSEFGICINCINYFQGEIPEKLRIPLGRFLLFIAQKNKHG
jgi:hypothetical protein